MCKAGDIVRVSTKNCSTSTVLVLVESVGGGRRMQGLRGVTLVEFVNASGQRRAVGDRVRFVDSVYDTVGTDDPQALALLARLRLEGRL